MHQVYIQEIERRNNPEEFSYDEFLQETGNE
jgi:hypothetical protein